MNKRQLKDNLSKFNPDAVLVCVSIKTFLKELDNVPSEVDVDSIRFDLQGNVYIEHDQFGFGGDWWKK